MWLMFKFILDDGEEQFTYHLGLWIPSRVVYMPDEVAVTIRIRRNPVTNVYAGSSAISVRGAVERIQFFDDEIDMA